MGRHGTHHSSGWSKPDDATAEAVHWGWLQNGCASSRLTFRADELSFMPSLARKARSAMMRSGRFRETAILTRRGSLFTHVYAGVDFSSCDF